MALMSQNLPSFTFHNISQNSPLLPNPPFFFSFTKRFKLLSLYSSPESSSFSSVSSPSIFLPFLEKEEQEQEELKEAEQSLEEEQNDDPIYRFFKSRTSTQDPPRESKLSLQRNRRTAWHLANHIENNETEIEVEVRKEDIKGKDELGIGESGEIEGIVGEIMRIARNLPENSTLGEQLMGYEGRIGEGECVEVLSSMIQEGLMMNCLYFYEWMGLQEPPLVTPRACSVLFPALGKAKMGDKLMVLWKNLPNIREYRDVHVYNAAMSGLQSCGSVLQMHLTVDF